MKNNIDMDYNRVNTGVVARRLAYLKSSVSLAVLVSVPFLAASAASQEAVQNNSQDDEFALETIIITARKALESQQEVPVTVSALTPRTLEQENIGNFDDFSFLVPTLSFVGTGPGGARPFIRGVATDSPELGASSGAQPSVAIYLDEQPISSIGRNLDVYVTDIAAIEVLPGPQGTLYGASSQSGTIKYITNKPDASEFSGRFEVEYADTKNGESSNVVKGFLNIPLVEDKAALRVVGWSDNQGGYIDNVAGTQFNPDGQGITLDNRDFVEDDFNDTNNSGIRAQLGINLNESWTATASYLSQKLERDGVFGHDPEDVGDLQVSRFFNDGYRDNAEQLGLTVEGDIGEYSLIYAGTFLDRDVDYQVDYSAYSLASPYIEYYVCDYDGTPTFTNCGDSRAQFTENTNYRRQNHEVRLQSPRDRRLKFLLGAFYEDNEQDFNLEWRSPGTTAAGSVRPNGVWFFTDNLRDDEQFSIFGETTFDLTETLSATFGVRYFDATASLTGQSASLFLDAQVDLTTKESDFIFKGNLSWQVTPDHLIYATYSEGFRVGGINREPVAGIIPENYTSDFIQNYEIGWKTEWLDGRVRFNGSAYYLDWSNVQLSTVDFSASFLTFVSNLGEASVKGVEADLTALISEGLTWTGSASYSDAELDADFTLGSNFSPAGTSLPFTPNFKASSALRYEYKVSNTLDGFTQFRVNYSGSSFNDIFANRRQVQASYTIGNFATGLKADNWNVEVFVSNVWNERAELFRSAIDADNLITTNRPRTVGIRMGYGF